TTRRYTRRTPFVQHPVRCFIFLPAPPLYEVERGLGGEVSLIQRRGRANVLFCCQHLLPGRHSHPLPPSRSVMLCNFQPIRLIIRLHQPQNFPLPRQSPTIIPRLITPPLYEVERGLGGEVFFLSHTHPLDIPEHHPTIVQKCRLVLSPKWR